MNTFITSIKRTESEVPEKMNIHKYRGGTVQKALLFCGFLSSLWYVAINIIVPVYYPGYSAMSLTVSELSAIGAPTRYLWVVLCIPYTLLEIAFGCGILLSAGRNRPLRVVGILLIIYGLIGAFWPPMHQREVLAAGGKSLTDTLHIIFTMVTGLLMMLAMGFGAAAFGKWFRRYSVVTILLLLIFGTTTGFYAPRLEANLPTPWMGVWERINIYATMLWLLVLAIVLLRKDDKLDLPTKSTSV